MDTINLQDKTSAEKGKVDDFWVESKNIFLKKTVFHSMNIPLKPFELELDGETQTIETQIAIDWLNLHLRDPFELDKLILKSSPNDGSEIFISIGDVRNPCAIKKMAINKISDNLYEIDCIFRVDFEHEKIAKNEIFMFKTQVELDPQLKGAK